MHTRGTAFAEWLFDIEQVTRHAPEDGVRHRSWALIPIDKQEQEKKRKPGSHILPVYTKSLVGLCTLSQDQNRLLQA